jgi:endonuclease-3 related protein
MILMTQHSRIADADAYLRQAYGTPASVETSTTWSLFLQVLLSGPEVPTDAVKNLLILPAFAAPASLSQMTAGQLVELLAGIPRGPQKASLLRSVAEWWIAQFGGSSSPEWSRGLEFYRESLRKIRGLGPATVDELLMFAAQLPVFPLDRGTLRVAIRHGWLDLPLEDEEAQNFFVRGLSQAEIDPRSFSRLVSRVAAAHCGREPNCEGCPLQPMLPPGGPINPDAA